MKTNSTLSHTGKSLLKDLLLLSIEYKIQDFDEVRFYLQRNEDIQTNVKLLLEIFDRINSSKSVITRPKEQKPKMSISPAEFHEKIKQLSDSEIKNLIYILEIEDSVNYSRENRIELVLTKVKNKKYLQKAVSYLKRPENKSALFSEMILKR